MSLRFHSTIAALTFTAIALALSGCSDDCERASDCLRTEVCYIGVCTPASAEGTCTGDEDCNVAMGTDRKCVAGQCIIDPSTVVQPCVITPACFDTMGSMPIDPQVMTATTGTTIDDLSAPMTGVVAKSPTGSSLVSIVAQNPLTNRYICMTLNGPNSTCDLIQVSIGDPTNAASTLFESTACSTNLDQFNAGLIEGEAAGTVRDCAGTTFEARASFNVAIQR